MRFVKTASMSAALVVCLLSFAASGNATVVNQWASTVIGFSSQYDNPSWAASQALLAPDTFVYDDIETAWAPLPMNSTPNSQDQFQWIALGYTTPVYASSVTIRETIGNGFVYQLDLIGQNNVLHTVFSGTDPSQPGTPVDFTINFPQTSYLVTGVKIYTDIDHNLDTWEEVDAVNLSGVPLPSTVLLLGSGLVGLLFLRRNRKWSTKS